MRALAYGGLALTLFLAAFFFTPSVYANTIVVTSDCTLAQAITTANDGSTQGSCASGADNAADTINFGSSVTSITLSANLPQISETLTIDGGTAGVSIDGKSGSDYYKLFVVKTSGAHLTLQNLTIKNGGYDCIGAGNPPSMCDDWAGGGAVEVLNGGNLTIVNSVIDTAYAGAEGGAIHVNNESSHGSVTIRSSTFRDGYAFGPGGILYWQAPSNAALTIEDSLFENGRGIGGGAIAIVDRSSPITATIKRSVFRSNTAHVDDDTVTSRGIGGAISTWGSTRLAMTIENSTFYGNEAKTKGGALYLTHGNANGSITLRHVTVAGNTTPAGKGAIYIDGANTKVKMYNSLIGNHGTTEDCKGTALNTNINSLSQDGTCTNSHKTGDPKLGAVTGSGAKTHYPLTAGSPAVDAAGGTTGECVTTDQIGTTRPQGAACDMGAIEFIPPPAPKQDEGSVSARSRRAAPIAPTAPGPLPAEQLNQQGYTITATHGLKSGIQCTRVGPEGVGIQWLLDLGFIDAVDCWGYVEQGVEVCFPVTGAVWFLDATTSPRTVTTPAAYINADGMTCARISRPGTIVLVRQGEQPQPQPQATPTPAATALTNCMVTALYALNFRDAPGGNIIGGVGYNWTLTALEKSGDWYKVDNNGAIGWISANHVSTHGVCA